MNYNIYWMQFISSDNYYIGLGSVALINNKLHKVACRAAKGWGDRKQRSYGTHKVACCGLFNGLATDNTVPVVCVWRHILVERASTQTWKLILQSSMHKHRWSTTVLHRLGV